MLADFHVLQALSGLWKRVVIEENFNGIFEKMGVQQSLVSKWRKVLCPNGDPTLVTFDEAFVHGQSKPPAFIVELATVEEFERTLGNSVLGSSGEMVTFLRSNVTITAWAATKSVTQAMSILAIAMLRHAQDYLRGRGYMGQGLVRGADLNAWEDLGPEKVGNFRRRITWRLEREYRFPPLLGDEPASTTIVVHHEDAVDAYGNPGQVSPRREV